MGLLAAMAAPSTYRLLFRRPWPCLGSRLIGLVAIATLVPTGEVDLSHARVVVACRHAVLVYRLCARFVLLARFSGLPGRRRLATSAFHGRPCEQALFSV